MEDANPETLEAQVPALIAPIAKGRNHLQENALQSRHDYTCFTQAWS